jgi:hypothetical protein
MHLPLFDYRCTEGVAVHVGQNGGHQGQKALGALLEQPEKSLSLATTGGCSN